MPETKALNLLGRDVVGLTSFMNPAGAQAVMVEISARLRARGFNCASLFVYRKAPAFEQEPGVEVLISGRPKPVSFLRSFLQLTEAFRRAKPRVFVGYLPLGNVFGGLAALLAGVRRRVATQHSPCDTFGPVMRFADLCCGAAGVYSSVVCVSQAVRDSFNAYPAAYRRRLTVIYNGIEWTPSPLSRAAARQRHGIGPDRPTFLAVGRLNKQKHFAFLLERVAETDGFDLIIAGEGPERGSLEQIIRERNLDGRVRLLGSVEPGAIKELLAATDAFIQSSIFEGHSIALLEAMHAGQAILSSDLPMQRESLCRDGRVAGLLVDLDDHDGWRDALTRLARDEMLRSSLGQEAKALVEEHFTVGKMIDEFQAVFQLDAPSTAAAKLQHHRQI